MPRVPNVPEVPLEGLYGQVVVDHCHNPRDPSPVPDPDVEAQDLNPFCGDEVRVQLKLGVQGQVAQVSFRAQGCSIIQASASMMTEAVEGKTLDQLEELAQNFRDMMQGDSPSDAEMGDLAALQVVRQFPVRIKCAMLPWTTLEDGIDEFRARSGADAG